MNVDVGIRHCYDKKKPAQKPDQLAAIQKFLVLERASEALLGHVVLDGPLLGGGALDEGRRSTEGTGDSGVLHADNADVAGATGRARADGASGHLDSDGEVHGLRTGETPNTETGDVLGDLSGLECRGVGATRGGVDLSGDGPGAVLVDLVENHLDGAILSAGGHAHLGSHAGGGLDSSLLGALGGGNTTAGSTRHHNGGAASEGGGVHLTGGDDCGGVGGSAVHVEADHLAGVDWALRVASEGGSLGGAEFIGADDGGVDLGAAAGSRAVTRSAIDNGKGGQGHTVGTLDLSDDTVGEDIGGSESRDEDGAGVLHFDCWVDC